LETKFDSISEGVLKEIGNIVLNSIIGTLCNNLKIQLKYTVPVFFEKERENIIEDAFSSEGVTGVFARIHFTIESINVQGDVMTVFNLDSFPKLLNLIDEYSND